MHLNVFSDIAEHCRTELKTAGYAVDSTKDAHELVLSYLTVARRVIPAKVRAVYVAQDLICPQGFQDGYDLIRQKAASGETLKPHQSKLLSRTDYSDALLNDWDLHHFHLGTKVGADGWVTRTGPLLFARVTPSAFYCVAIVHHGAWHQQALLESVHKNWPTSIAHAKLNGVVALEHVPSDEDVMMLRRAYINTMLQMADGTVYMPPGGGCSSDSSSTRAVLAKNSLVRYARAVEKQVEDRLATDFGNTITQAIAPALFDRTALQFQFRLGAGDARIVELGSDIYMQFDPLQLPPITG